MDNKSLGERDAFIENNLGLVGKVTERFRQKLQRYEGMADLEDIFQIGCIGLVKAYDRFDASKGFMFSTYAVPMIEGEIRRFLRDFNTGCYMPRPIKDEIPSFKRKGLGATSPVEEICEKMGWTQEKTRNFLEAYNSRSIMSFDIEFDDSQGSKSYKDLLRNRDNVEDHAILRDFISQLNEKQKMTFDLYYVKGYSQDEIGAMVGLAQVSIGRFARQIRIIAKEYDQAV